MFAIWLLPFNLINKQRVKQIAPFQVQVLQQWSQHQTMFIIFFVSESYSLRIKTSPNSDASHIILYPHLKVNYPAPEESRLI